MNHYFPLQLKQKQSFIYFSKVFVKFMDEILTYTIQQIM